MNYAQLAFTDGPQQNHQPMSDHFFMQCCEALAACAATAFAIMESSVFTAGPWFAVRRLKRPAAGRGLN